MRSESWASPLSRVAVTPYLLTVPYSQGNSNLRLADLIPFPAFPLGRLWLPADSLQSGFGVRVWDVPCSRCLPEICTHRDVNIVLYLTLHNDCLVPSDGVCGSSQM